MHLENNTLTRGENNKIKLIAINNTALYFIRVELSCIQQAFQQILNRFKLLRKIFFHDWLNPMKVELWTCGKHRFIVLWCRIWYGIQVFFSQCSVGLLLKENPTSIQSDFFQLWRIALIFIFFPILGHPNIEFF